MDESPETPSPAPPGAPPPVAPLPPLLANHPSVPRKKEKGGRGWMVFAILLCVALAFSVLANLTQFARNFLHGPSSRYAYRVGPRIDEVLVEDNSSANKLAIIEVEGIISGGMFEQGGFSMVELIKAQFRRAAEDRSVRGVILKVDSPGGEVLASDEISRTISDFQKNTGKPVVAAMGDLAASGGYYVSAPCRWIVANELTLTGSIGVILSSWNYYGLMSKVGIQPKVYKSGKFKDMLSGSRDPDLVSPEEDKMLQGIIEQTFSRFKQVVATGREQAHRLNNDLGRALTPDWADYADGRVLTGTDAYKLGFVDELGNFEDAVKRTRKLAGVSSADLINYQQRYDFTDFLRLFGKKEGATFKVDLGMDQPKVKAGQPYFLAPNYVR
jgi:protease IV